MIARDLAADFAETDQPQLARMWEKRRRGYRAMGYGIRSPDRLPFGIIAPRNE